MTEATEKKGLLNRDKVYTFLFGLINLPLFAAVLIIIFAIWDDIGPEVAYKSVATLGTLIAGGSCFTLVNDYFDGKQP